MTFKRTRCRYHTLEVDEPQILISAWEWIEFKYLQINKTTLHNDLSVPWEHSLQIPNYHNWID